MTGGGATFFPFFYFTMCTFHIPLVPFYSSKDVESVSVFTLALWTKMSVWLQELPNAKDDWGSTRVDDIHTEPALWAVPTHPAGLTVECRCSVSTAHKSRASNLHLESTVADFLWTWGAKNATKSFCLVNSVTEYPPTVQMSTRRILLGWQMVSPRQLSSCQACLQPWHGEISFHLTYTPR